ncbi:flavin reductase [Microbacterium sp. zg.B48]|uniref:flavin reductase n=1 Tax=Microbacterium sp. zg.B48 TaxID=2969408 RepID=UPI00214CB550|nr:flavin reductase [Microbacterium sp. zg.B48]MCR2765015.1 flavin reductase [Microbacterium sp. zg.B48]
MLGNFPTGVAVITSIDREGEPVGMAVGSFTSVSLQPPLVAFLPTRSSSTFPAIQEAGRFCVNILAGGQEALSQSFATKKLDRFMDVNWQPAPRTGSPILSDALAWVDCEIEKVYDGGDHHIVIGRVLALEVERPGLPLLYFQGGYGTFTLRSLVLATRGRLNESARIADEAREDLEGLSADVGLECRVSALDGNDLTIVATTGYEGPADRVGVVLPFMPRFGITIAAWGPPELRETWFAASPIELSAEQRALLDEELDRIRQQGWTLSYASEPEDQAAEALEMMAAYGLTPRLHRTLVEASRQLVPLPNPPALTTQTAGSVRTLMAPVISERGPELHLTLHGFRPGSDLAFIEHARDKLIETSRRVSARLGGC